MDISHNQDLILQFDLKAEALLGDRVVGRAFIPVADLDFSGAVQHVSYQVKTPEGKANGAINFSYKVVGAGAAAVLPPIVPGPTLAMDYSPPEQSFYTAPSAPPVSSYSPQPAAASGFYPTVDPVVGYPLPGTTASGIYPPPQSSAGYYLMMDQGGSYRPLLPDAGGYYPPPAYPPQPASQCCCRSVPQPPLAWYYPSTQQPALDAYGYQHRGLYGYN